MLFWFRRKSLSKCCFLKFVFQFKLNRSRHVFFKVVVVVVVVAGVVVVVVVVAGVVAAQAESGNFSGSNRSMV